MMKYFTLCVAAALLCGCEPYCSRGLTANGDRGAYDHLFTVDDWHVVTNMTYGVSRDPVMMRRCRHCGHQEYR